MSDRKNGQNSIDAFHPNDGLLETVISIARKRGEIINKIKKAVERGDREATFALASELVGIPLPKV